MGVDKKRGSTTEEEKEQMQKKVSKKDEGELQDVKREHHEYQRCLASTEKGKTFTMVKKKDRNKEKRTNCVTCSWFSMTKNSQ